MRVEAREPANAASIAVGSLVRSHPRYRSAVTAAGLSPAVTVNRLNPDAAETLSPPASRTRLEWPRGGSMASGTGDLDEVHRRSAPAERRTSQGKRASRVGFRQLDTLAAPALTPQGPGARRHRLKRFSAPRRAGPVKDESRHFGAWPQAEIPSRRYKSK